MNNPLDALEARIDQVVALIEGLRAENDALKAQVATDQAEIARLRQLMATATDRLTQLMNHLPEDA